MHHDGQVVDHSYPWNLDKESDHSLYEEWSRWRYNETEGVDHELSSSFGENLMPKRWPKTLPSRKLDLHLYSYHNRNRSAFNVFSVGRSNKTFSPFVTTETPRPVDVGSVAVVDSAVIAIGSGKTVVSPPADIAAKKINIAVAPSNVKWEHLPVVFLFCLCVFWQPLCLWFWAKAAIRCSSERSTVAVWIEKSANRHTAARQSGIQRQTLIRWTRGKRCQQRRFSGEKRLWQQFDGVACGVVRWTQLLSVSFSG